MSDWNSNQYMKFGAERTQPSIDLVNRIADTKPKHILDIGCGPGNSTHRLAEQFPNADILGVDYSEDMLKKAQATYPELKFEQSRMPDDLDKLNGKFDLIFQTPVSIGSPTTNRFLLRFSISSMMAAHLLFRFRIFKKHRFIAF